MEIASSLVRAAEDAVAEKKMKTAFMLLDNAAVTLLQAMQDFEFQGETCLTARSFANAAKYLPHLASVVSTMATVTELLRPRSSSLKPLSKRPSSPAPSLNKNIPHIPTPLILRSYLSACSELAATNSKLKALSPDASAHSRRRLIELRALCQLQIDQIEAKMKSGSALSISQIQSPGDIAKVIVSVSARLQSSETKSKKDWLVYLENLTARLIIEAALESTTTGASALQKLISTAELLLTKYKDFGGGQSVLRGTEHPAVTRLVCMWGSANPSVLKTLCTLRAIVPSKKPKKLAEVKADEQMECWLLNQAYVQDNHLLKQSFLAEPRRPEEEDPRDRLNRAQHHVESLALEADVPSPPDTPIPCGGLHALINALLTKQPVESSTASQSLNVWSPSSGPLASRSKPTLSTSLTSASRDQSPLSPPVQSGNGEIEEDMLSVTDSAQPTPPSTRDSFDWASAEEADELRQLTRKTVQKVMDEMHRTRENISRKVSQKALNETKVAAELEAHPQHNLDSAPSHAPVENFKQVTELVETLPSLPNATVDITHESRPSSVSNGEEPLGSIHFSLQKSAPGMPSHNHPDLQENKDFINDFKESPQIHRRQHEAGQIENSKDHWKGGQTGSNNECFENLILTRVNH